MYKRNNYLNICVVETFIDNVSSDIVHDIITI